MEYKDFDNFLETASEKWVAIGGNRWIDSKIADKIEYIVKELIKNKCKIVTGGAMGTDYTAIKSCLKYKISRNSLKIFMPLTIEEQHKYESKRVGQRKAKELLKTLSKIKKYYPKSIVENKKRFRNYREAAYFRNSLVVRQADAAIIFKLGNSIGTLDALNKIKRKKIPYIIFN